MTQLGWRSLHKTWATLPIRHQGTIVLAIPAAFLVVTLAAWIWSRQSVLDVQAEIDHTESVIATNESLLRTLLDAETAVRGYGINRDPDFLAPYYEAIETLPGVRSQLRQLLSNTPQQPQFQSLDQQIQQRMSFLTQRLELLQTGAAPSDPRSLQLAYQGLIAMTAIRTQIDDLEQSQRHYLQGLRQSSASLQQKTIMLLWFTVSIGLLGYSIAVYLFSQLDWELQEREVLLSESTTLMREIMQHLVDGVITLNRRGEIESVNPAAASMFHYAPDQVIGKEISTLLIDPTYQASAAIADPDEQDPRLWDKPTLQVGGSWEDTGYRQDGTSFPLEISISNTRLADQMVAIVRDISDRKQAEEKLKAYADEMARLNILLAKANTDLENRNQELDQFAYVTSHDLKAPLRAIANLSEWIEEDLNGQLTDDSKHHMTLLRQRTHRMEALINGLLEYSRIGRTHTPIVTVSVQTLLAEIIDSLAPPPRFTIEIGQSMPTFQTRQLLLRQVFANLLSNAIKHHPRDDGHVSITVEEQGAFYQFSVTDDGLGIDPKYHSRVFTIFQTLEARDKVENTGVGLSIVKKIVEAEGGAIALQSQPGQGATFLFTWRKHPPGAT